MDTAPGPAMICTMYLNKMECKWRLISPTLRLYIIHHQGWSIPGTECHPAYAMHRITQVVSMCPLCDAKNRRSFQGLKILQDPSASSGSYSQASSSRMSSGCLPDCFPLLPLLQSGKEIVRRANSKSVRFQGFRLPSNSVFLLIQRCWFFTHQIWKNISESQIGFHETPRFGVNISCFNMKPPAIVIYLMQMMDVNDVPLETLQELLQSSDPIGVPSCSNLHLGSMCTSEIYRMSTKMPRLQ